MTKRKQRRRSTPRQEWGRTTYRKVDGWTDSSQAVFIGPSKELRPVFEARIDELNRRELERLVEDRRGQNAYAVAEAERDRLASAEMLRGLHFPLAERLGLGPPELLYEDQYSAHGYWERGEHGVAMAPCTCGNNSEMPCPTKEIYKRWKTWPRPLPPHLNWLGNQTRTTRERNLDASSSTASSQGSQEG